MSALCRKFRAIFSIPIMGLCLIALSIELQPRASASSGDCRPDDWQFANPLRPPYTAEQVRAARAYVNGVVDSHLEKAIQSGRRFGLEVEFRGVRSGAVFQKLRTRLGGQLKGLIKFKTADPEVLSREFSVKVDIPNLKNSFYLSETTDSGLKSLQLAIYNEKGVPLDVFSFDSMTDAKKGLMRILQQIEPSLSESVISMKMSGKTALVPAEIDGKKLYVSYTWNPANNRMVVQALDENYAQINDIPILFAGRVGSEADFNAAIASISQVGESVISGATRLEGSSIGTVRLELESSSMSNNFDGSADRDIDALELITDPLTYDQMPIVEGIMEDLRVLGARGTSDQHALGIHVNVEVDPKNESAMSRLIRNFNYGFQRVARYFNLHPSRFAHAGPEDSQIIAELDHQSRMTSSPTHSSLSSIYAAADARAGRTIASLPGYERIGDGKPTAMNVRHAIAGRRPAVEFRLFNTDGFANIRAMVNYALSEVERAFNP